MLGSVAVELLSASSSRCRDILCTFHCTHCSSASMSPNRRSTKSGSNLALPSTSYMNLPLRAVLQANLATGHTESSPWSRPRGYAWMRQNKTGILVLPCQRVIYRTLPISRISPETTCAAWRRCQTPAVSARGLDVELCTISAVTRGHRRSGTGSRRRGAGFPPGVPSAPGASLRRTMQTLPRVRRRPWTGGQAGFFIWKSGRERRCRGDWIWPPILAPGMTPRQLGSISPMARRSIKCFWRERNGGVRNRHKNDPRESVLLPPYHRPTSAPPVGFALVIAPPTGSPKCRRLPLRVAPRRSALRSRTASAESVAAVRETL
jgi:hypothetical protein